MKSAKKAVVAAGLVLGIACGVACLVIIQRHVAAEAASPSARAEPQTVNPARPLMPPPVAEAPAAEKRVDSPESPPPKQLAEASGQGNAKSQPATPPNPPSGAADPPTTDELARVALSLVGADAEAEQYWIAAINDPDLPADERRNLIEDLNEDGLSDPKHPTPADLPLILSRLQLIPELALDPMDEVNAEALQEAYKDLVNLADLAQGRGGPVK
jgi:hypothetical protein